MIEQFFFCSLENLHRLIKFFSKFHYKFNNKQNAKKFFEYFLLTIRLNAAKRNCLDVFLLPCWEVSNQHAIG